MRTASGQIRCIKGSVVMSEMITISLPKGSVLVIPQEQYDVGIKRGKAYRRREQFQKRMARIQQEREAAKSAEPATG
jgi:hypothetical protein